MKRVHRWERWKRPSERVMPAAKAPRRIKTPLPEPARARPEFEARILGDVTVLVSAGAARFPGCSQLEALAAHGPLTTGSRETKHRFKQGALVVVHTASKREVLLLTASELRSMRGSLDARRRSG